MAFEKTKHFKVNFVPKDQWELKFNGIMHKSTNSFSNVIKKRMKIVKEKYSYYSKIVFILIYFIIPIWCLFIYLISKKS